MADCMNHGMEEYTSDNNKTTTILSSLLNRSMTINSSAENTNKPLYNIYNSPAFKRNGSIKSVHGSSVTSIVSFKGKVRKLCSILESQKNKPKDSSFDNLINTKNDPTPHPLILHGAEDRVVIYTTSLRGIRRTFQDCHSIRMIFVGFRVDLDERDISMDAAYKRELQRVLGENNVKLPQIFIKGKYIGGADVIKQLLENGELVKLIKGLPLRAPKPCHVCGDVRFVPCMNCDGSCKVYDEDDGLPKRCNRCNENGLVRCPLCRSM
ncbi:hypothetical protein ACJIZ3_018598 [Penstemon smallii]|uniref:Glutaredoxin domain-containing protein n=1 Tax=Penstemon smallii TaxID=265156 RepID=A0ABD3SZN6_9LAMI